MMNWSLITGTGILRGFCPKLWWLSANPPLRPCGGVSGGKKNSHRLKQMVIECQVKRITHYTSSHRLKPVAIECAFNRITNYSLQTTNYFRRIIFFT